MLRFIKGIGTQERASFRNLIPIILSFPNLSDTIFTMAPSNRHTLIPSAVSAPIDAPGVKGKKVASLKSNSQESINRLINSIISSDPDHNDPFYVLDLGTVTNLYHKWTHHLPSVQPFFAVKCNPETALIGTLSALGANFDCASHAEIESVLALGIAPDRIVYANPCKAESHIRFSRSMGVSLTTFDSVYELEKIRRHHPTCSLLLRIKPPVSTGVRRSLGAKYGARPEEVGPLLEAARSMNLSVVGVSFHIGSSATVSETYEPAIAAARAVFNLAYQISGTKMHVLNIGGGFVAGPLFEKAAKVINSSVAAHFGDWPDLRVMAEPGRYLAETAATLATCVIGKRVRGEKREYWVNDGIYGSMYCAKMDAVDVTVEPLERRPDGAEKYASTVFGPTCDSMDVVAGEVQLPEMDVGEWIVSRNMGAYAKAMGSSFNGFSTPAIRVHLAYSMNRN